MNSGSSQKKPATNGKRPYRRTKRPKNYNDKSTVTTTTVTPKNVHVNVYDAVLHESRDLMKAASEAQQLGRLKMAASLQLLLHARLVGLGKRFDKAQVPAVTTEEATTTDSTIATLATPTPGISSAATAPEPPTPTTTAARELAKMLPGNIEMDQTMMEHLAKAAAELHAARSGRKRSWNDEEPLTADEFFRQTNAPGGTAATAAAVAAGKKVPGVAWSVQETQQLEKAISDGCSTQQIAIRTKKSEAQVKAFLRNQTARSKVEADLELPDTSPKKKGRGRKPATTAISTVPHATCDARLLLAGKGLTKE